MYQRFTINSEHIRRYREDGYLMVPGLFDEEEMSLLLATAKSDRELEKHSMGLDDGRGGISRLSLWYEPGEDIYGIISRCHRVVDAMEALIGHEVYHYHSKMMLKEPFTGGAWSWHQDYGYWYKAGYLFPAMASCLIAVDRATLENGCLQVLKGSHKMGRVEHVLTGEQTGAEPERLRIAFDVFERVYCEMEAGSALFFHGNLLHGSEQNQSPNPRWSLISCYTATYNLPYNEPQHPGYKPLVKADDDAIKKAGRKGLSGRESFLSPGHLDSSEAQT